jgi:hypothetical protein
MSDPVYTERDGAIATVVLNKHARICGVHASRR